MGKRKITQDSETKSASNCNYWSCFAGNHFNLKLNNAKGIKKEEKF